jgi:hypothetical protein
VVEITIKLTALDYESMCENGSHWSDAVAGKTDTELLERYQSETNPGQVPGRHWKRDDVIGIDRKSLIFVRSFLDAQDIPYEVVYDMFTWDNGMEIGWLILSDYDNYNDPVVAEHRRLWQLQRATSQGDELAQRYYEPSAGTDDNP